MDALEYDRLSQNGEKGSFPDCQSSGTLAGPWWDQFVKAEVQLSPQGASGKDVGTGPTVTVCGVVTSLHAHILSRDADLAGMSPLDTG